MLILRPVRDDDLPGLVALVEGIEGGLTTLPPDRAFLQERIDASQRAFDPRVKRPGGEYYLFVLEDTTSGEILGTAGITSRVGGFDPWYTYEIRDEFFQHAPLRIEKQMAVLHLKKEHRGPSELCSLYLRADRRHGGAGRLLSLGRLLFIAAFPERFTDEVVAEMRGYIDQTGRSPFWEAVGRPFFEFDFYAADVLSGLGNKAFIADLMPEHPIYVALLPRDVQAVIGRVHHDTEPALALLRAEGFELTREVDIFDAGPVLRARTAGLRTINQARRLALRDLTGPLPADAPVRLLANGALDFRATAAATLEHPDGTVALEGDVAAMLRVDRGGTLWVAPVK